MKKKKIVKKINGTKTGFLNSEAVNLTSNNSVDNDVICTLFDFVCSSIARSTAFSLADHIALSSSISKSESVSCCKIKKIHWNALTREMS